MSLGKADKNCSNTCTFSFSGHPAIAIATYLSCMCSSSFIACVNFYFNPFPDDKNLTLSKLKAFAEDKINET